MVNASMTAVAVKVVFAAVVTELEILPFIFSPIYYGFII
jgi:hypothetical protein